MTAGPERIACTIRCLRPEDVESARRALSGAPSARVPYVCRVSGRREAVRLVAPDRAAALAAGDPELPDPLAATLACALLETELCECDLATVAGRPEGEVLGALADLEARGVVAWRRVDSMRYFRLADPALAARLAAAAGDAA